MGKFVAILITAGFLASWASAQTPRFVIDDDDYLDGVVRAAEKLRAQHRLLPLARFEAQVRRGGKFAVPPVPLSREKASPPDLYDRLLESTFAVGPFYKCPDCAAWHFMGGAGFAVTADGVLSTCCHVLSNDDEEVKEAYLIAADAQGHVYPVKKVLAADADSDTCFVQIDATGLTPLPLRAGARTGERLYCLSHPGGNHFMFTQGMIARVTQSRNCSVDDKGATNVSRPVLYLNITAEYAPGSSGAPVVDEAGNVVGQVTSISDAGEPLPEDTSESAPNTPSVPVRFCIAAEEIQRLEEGPKTTPAPARPAGKPSHEAVKASGR